MWYKNWILNSQACVHNGFRVLCREEVPLPLFPIQSAQEDSLLSTIISSGSSPWVISFSSLIAVARTSFLCLLCCQMCHSSLILFPYYREKAATLLLHVVTSHGSWNLKHHRTASLWFSHTIYLTLITLLLTTLHHSSCCLWITTSRDSLKGSYCSSLVRATHGSFTQNKTV